MSGEVEEFRLIMNAQAQAEFCEAADPQSRPCRACYGCVGWERDQERAAKAQDPEHLRSLLAEAVEWARRSSPIPWIPFDDFLTRCGEVGIGPRAAREGT